ncbi:MAG: hypothetical protein IPJ88_02445 [Myxococcales bacterium]|nr:MAG: hypothetical protein IPJ88_02445 [Myxococcales bacterium]
MYKKSRFLKQEVLALLMLSSAIGCSVFKGNGSGGAGSSSGSEDIDDDDSVVAVVFAKEAITEETYDSENPKFTKKFALGDPIYSRVYVRDAQSFRAHQQTPGEALWVLLAWDIPVSSQVSFSDEKQFKFEADLDKSVTDFPLLTDSYPEDFVVKNRADEKVDVLSEVSASLLKGCEKMAETKSGQSLQLVYSMPRWGAFSLQIDCNEEGKATVAGIAKAAKIKKLESVRMPKAGKIDKKLSKAFLAAAKRHTDRTHIDEQSKILASVITSDRWLTERNEATGVVLSRSMHIEIAVQGDDPDICKVERVRVTEDANGSKFSGEYYVSTTSLENKEILCKHAAEKK